MLNCSTGEIFKIVTDNIVKILIKSGKFQIILFERVFKIIKANAVDMLTIFIFFK